MTATEQVRRMTPKEMWQMLHEAGWRVYGQHGRQGQITEWTWREMSLYSFRAFPPHHHLPERETIDGRMVQDGYVHWIGRSWDNRLFANIDRRGDGTWFFGWYSFTGEVDRWDAHGAPKAATRYQTVNITSAEDLDTAAREIFERGFPEYEVCEAVGRKEPRWDILCHVCRGEKYIGIDGHTCSYCEGSGYEPDDEDY